MVSLKLIGILPITLDSALFCCFTWVLLLILISDLLWDLRKILTLLLFYLFQQFFKTLSIACNTVRSTYKYIRCKCNIKNLEMINSSDFFLDTLISCSALWVGNAKEISCFEKCNFCRRIFFILWVIF